MKDLKQGMMSNPIITILISALLFATILVLLRVVKELNLIKKSVSFEGNVKLASNQLIKKDYNSIIRLISIDKLELAIEALLNFSSDSGNEDLLTQVVLLKGDMIRVNIQNSKNLFKKEEYNMERSRIATRAIHIINSIQKFHV